MDTTTDSHDTKLRRVLWAQIALALSGIPFAIIAVILIETRPDLNILAIRSLTLGSGIMSIIAGLGLALYGWKQDTKEKRELATYPSVIFGAMSCLFIVAIFATSHSAIFPAVQAMHVILMIIWLTDVVASSVHLFMLLRAAYLKDLADRQSEVAKSEAQAEEPPRIPDSQV